MINYRKTEGGEEKLKYWKTPLRLFLWMLIGSLISIAVSTFVTELYNLLNKLMPSVFPSYDITSGDVFFESIHTSLWFVSLLISLFTSVYFSLRYDNDKFEYIVTKTEGYYKIRGILPTYINIFGLSDAVSCVVLGSIFTIPFFFVPIQFIKNQSFLAKIAEPYKLMGECFGYAAPIVMIFLIALCFIASIPLALKYYRARWFSAFSEV